MALTEFQREICRLLAERRIASGEAYVAGGAALNEILAAPRISQDLDLFHDTAEALAATWDADRSRLLENRFGVDIVRERPSFVEAQVSRGTDQVVLQWAQDSAYRFFPLVEREPFGLTLHPFDLATNKVLALVGRVEARDFVDVVESCEKIQPLGYLAWAACGKDPGFSPASILAHASRSVRYSAAEVGALQFSGPAPDAAALSQRWRELLEGARATIDQLPPEQAGRCVLSRNGQLYMGDSTLISAALERNDLLFHEGRIRGALPNLMAGDQ